MRPVVLLARKLDQGGAERQLITLAKALHDRGHDVRVVLFYSGGVLDEEVARAGVPLHFVGKRGRWHVLSFMVRLVRIVRALRPAVIYSFLDLPNLLSTLLQPVVGRPRLIWSIRNSETERHHYDWLHRLIQHLEAKACGAADVTVANSYAGAGWAVTRGFAPTRVTVVENGIDTQRFYPDTNGRARVRGEWEVGAQQRLIGLVARLDVLKDHPSFLRACALLAQQHDELRFVCVGAGTVAYRAELAALAVELGISARLIWAGARQDMSAVYSALDVVCSSSISEGFPNVIGEAMACAVPCVVTDVGDSARVVGALGEIVAPHNAVALAGALARMLARIETDTDLGSRARARVIEEFSVDRMVLRTEHVIWGRAPNA